MNEQTLIEKYLKEYTFKEYHEILVDGPIGDVNKVANNIDLSKSKIVIILFKLRGLSTKRMNLQDLISDLGFTKIEERYPTEKLFGVWGRTKPEPISNYKDFIDNTISARMKIVWNFSFSSTSSTQTKVSTETRILCLNPVVKVIFSLYWLIIRPFSGLIRIKMLEIIKEESENIQKNG